jgi:hypothetical protein
MNSPLELIQIVESAGARFMVDGDRLGIFPKEAAAAVRAQLIEHKQEVLALLAQRPSLPPTVKLVRWEPKIAPVQISKCTTVVDVEKFISATLGQLAAHLNGQYWQAGNWPLATLLARLEAVGCVVELDHPGRVKQ